MQIPIFNFKILASEQTFIINKSHNIYFINKKVRLKSSALFSS
ncbi:hypothetical protein BV140_1617 [Haemophilus influenzae]|nr:hypothetical protein H733_0980 [Haemophilus influenzae CGSHiCZ412602]AVI96589.1 hypothetical protein BV083_1556 [Haemophilus influenzae]EGF16459.1 hypothetical protein HMPREF9095_1204 [Haemophilus aegyptius ATCC 11116]AVI98363.1 hypothetical protein BV085_1555 [Haemophilus influenzae]AVJ00312.1 hypothetical protein BV121_1726 [Haemophilus influenzae]